MEKTQQVTDAEIINISHSEQIEELKKRFKVNWAEENSIERLIANESKLLRRKLYEAYSKPFSGRQRSFTVSLNLCVEEK